MTTIEEIFDLKTLYLKYNKVKAERNKYKKKYRTQRLKRKQLEEKIEVIENKLKRRQLMITAEEAKSRSNYNNKQVITEELQTIESLILIASQKGEYSIKLEKEKLYSNTLYALEENHYSVTFLDGCTIISWAKC